MRALVSSVVILGYFLPESHDKMIGLLAMPVLSTGLEEYGKTFNFITVLPGGPVVGRWRQMPGGVGSIPSCCNSFFFIFLVKLLFLSFT